MPAKKILLVDDDTRFLEMMRMTLRLNGYDCLTAESVVSAYGKCLMETPDLIVSDINMPGEDGFSLRRRLLNNDGTRYIPFLFLTSEASESTMLTGYSLDIDDYISKSMTPAAILAKIRSGISLRERTEFRQREEIKKEVEHVREDLAPIALPKLRNYEVDTLIVPHNAVTGGDFLDFIALPDGRTVAVFADVVGKNWRSWFLSFSYISYIRSAVRSMTEIISSPAQVLRRLNELILQDEQMSKYFFSLSLLVLDDNSSSISYSAAASYPIMKISPDRTAALCYSSGELLGIRHNAEFESSTIEMGEGDELLLLSDGIFECKSPDYKDFSIDGVRAVIKSCQPGANLFDCMMKKLKMHSADNISDDLSLLKIVRKKQ